VEIIRNAYKLYNKADLPVHDICEGEHCWHDDNLEKIIKYFGKKLA
jgi:hypothetical protein